MPVIGFLHSGSPEPNVNQVAAFRKGLGEVGYVLIRKVDVLSSRGVKLTT
jgi:hypothetical protein